MNSTMTRIEQFENTAFHTYNLESKYTADTSLVTKAMIDVIFERHAPFADGEIEQVRDAIAKVVDEQTKRFK